MSNGARHGLGVLIGLVVTPVIALCLMYSTTKFTEYFRYFFTRGGEDRWIGAAVVLVAAVLVGLAAGSRVSPLASLIPGAAYTAIGVLWLASPRFAVGHSGRDLLGRELYLGYATLAPYGIFLLLGVALLVASLAPSRWKARTAAAPRFGGPPPAPMGPPPMHGAQAPMGAPQPPPSPGQGPPWQGGPQYGQPPAQPHGRPSDSNPPPLPPARRAENARPEPPARSGSDDDEPPGEWTQMYGGNRPS
ncbi:hypothetical protein [Actinomadura mexicana]|uniref:Uncharacterized protein n=1 Tax=Actinomadura mexicana TaxID=134959 RepID=A0A239ENM8_9ACTN|nr:hypothetical protein [Actinomadura mexicana]SNS46011.1 hypothetical protein SAMN06265355_1186 [Actinomadura mexicana]